ncbi:MAG: DUF367 family protein [Candidatus Bathyarchaeia archaeon]
MFSPKLYVYLMGQDDPSKCTSAKLVRFNLAKPIRSRRLIPRRAILLNPSSNLVLTPSDKENVDDGGVVAVDCSWKRIGETFNRRFPGLNRRLPSLLAANPVSYAKIGVLSSAEALAASLIITSYNQEGERILKIYKWGQTFLTLNMEPLKEYSRAKSLEDVLKVEEAYFGSTNIKETS